MKRTSTHVIETDSTDIVVSRINSYFEDGSALFRHLTGRDYGVDGVIELFDNGCPTGKFALAQIKGTKSTITPLRTHPVVSCRISSSNLLYIMQDNTPVVLLYVSTKDSLIYYLCMNEIIEDIQEEKMEQGSVTLHIPVENNSLDDFGGLFDSINNFYDKRRTVN